MNIFKLVVSKKSILDPFLFNKCDIYTHLS